MMASFLQPTPAGCVYSFGVVLWELWTNCGQVPYASMGLAAAQMQIKAGVLLDVSRRWLGMTMLSKLIMHDNPDDGFGRYRYCARTLDCSSGAGLSIQAPALRGSRLAKCLKAKSTSLLTRLSACLQCQTCWVTMQQLLPRRRVHCAL